MEPVAEEHKIAIDHQSYATTSETDSSQTAPPVDSLHVLLTEDCPDQGRLYLKFLQMAGAEVTLECSGRSAVDVVRKTPTLFDVIIMDFQMPEIDGIESTKQMRELGYEGPIIAMTAFGSEELKQSWFQAGCNEYLEKPLMKSELLVAVIHHMKV